MVYYPDSEEEVNKVEKVCEDIKKYLFENQVKPLDAYCSMIGLFLAIGHALNITEEQLDLTFKQMKEDYLKITKNGYFK